MIPAHLLRALAIVIALLVALPVLSVFAHLLVGGTEETWSHLLATVLGEYVVNTLKLCLGVGVGVAVLGTATAWLTTMHEFPGRRVFEWALVLPMAMPAYVLAYVYTDLLQFVGPVQTFLRESLGWQPGEYWFPDVRSVGGAVCMLTCVLFPYAYTLIRTAFMERAGGMLEAGRTLGLGPWAAFFRLSLPLARPAVVAGVTLALMETLADYGTVQYFGVQTFTTGIYRAWFSLGDRVAAAQLASSLLGLVIMVLTLERLSRGQARFHNTGRSGRSQRVRLQPLAGWLATVACALPVVSGFVLPAILLLRMALTDGDAEFGWRFVTLARNSFLLASLTAVLAVVLVLVLAYSARLSRAAWSGWVNRVASLGYAVPGAVIAVGILIPVTRLDHLLAALWTDVTGQSPGLLLTGSVAALIYACLVRFLAVALHGVEESLARVTRSMDEAAQSFGLSRWQTLRRVHLPMLRGSLLTAGLLVFVDVMKELPATLVMRPFNFDTLATQTFILAADERLTEASTAALAIVVVGLVPVILLSRQIARHGTVRAC